MIGPKLKDIAATIKNMSEEGVSAATEMVGNVERATFWVAVKKTFEIDLPTRLTFRTVGEAGEYLFKLGIRDL
jgi:hypothetical protein